MSGNYIENFFRKLGKPLVRFVSGLGELSLFIAKSVYNSVTPPFYLKLLGKQMIDIGFYSLPVVALTTIFAGMVIALQTYSGFSSYGAESAVASVVLISVTRELAPVFSGLMVAGRIGAAMAAEIGFYLYFCHNPFKYLVAPRVLAGITVLPLLVLIGDVIGIFGGFIIAVYKLGFNPANYINSTINGLESLDIVTGVVKACVFGFIIAIMGCYNGYKSRGGAQGVGEATTNAVVSASILILIFNYIITELFFAK